MTNFQNVMQILELGGETFIEAAYQTLLGRRPDPSGQEHYQDCLARGVSKATILVALASSPEGRARNAACDGMPELLAMNRRTRHPIWKWLLRSLRIERQTHRLEWKMGYIEEQILALRQENHAFWSRSGGGGRIGTSALSGNELEEGRKKRKIIFKMEKNNRFFKMRSDR